MQAEKIKKGKVYHSSDCQEAEVSSWAQQQQFVAEAGERRIGCAHFKSKFHNFIWVKGVKVIQSAFSILKQLWI